MAMNMVLLIVGVPLDLPPALLLFGPIFVPLGASIGLDPVQLGLIMIINLGIGLYTPPVGHHAVHRRFDLQGFAGRRDQRALAFLFCSNPSALGDDVYSSSYSLLKVILTGSLIPKPISVLSLCGSWHYAEGLCSEKPILDKGDLK